MLYNDKYVDKFYIKPLQPEIYTRDVIVIVVSRGGAGGVWLMITDFSRWKI